MSSIITREFLAWLRAQYQLDWLGIHGVRHWARVRATGLTLARTTGASPPVVELFSFLHDCARWDDGEDPEHGYRAGKLARVLNGDLFHLEQGELDVLVEALEGHDLIRWHGHPTIATCWDADRIDLSRVGVRPDPRFLCTEPGKRMALALPRYAHTWYGVPARRAWPERRAGRVGRVG